MFRVVKGLAPSFITDIVSINVNLNTENVSANTRSPFRFYNQSHPKINSYGLETLRCIGPEIWSMIPNDIKTSTSLPIFKNKLKSWIPVNSRCRLCAHFLQQILFLYRSNLVCILYFYIICFSVIKIFLHCITVKIRLNS